MHRTVEEPGKQGVARSQMQRDTSREPTDTQRPEPATPRRQTAAPASPGAAELGDGDGSSWVWGRQCPGTRQSVGAQRREGATRHRTVLFKVRDFVLCEFRLGKTVVKISTVLAHAAAPSVIPWHLCAARVRGTRQEPAWQCRRLAAWWGGPQPPERGVGHAGSELQPRDSESAAEPRPWPQVTLMTSPLCKWLHEW